MTDESATLEQLQHAQRLAFESYCVRLDNGCIELNTPEQGNGYRCVPPGPLFRKKGVTRIAHRWLWEWHHGPINDRTLLVLHNCDNRACVNIKHLRLGTAKENFIDAIRRGRLTAGQLDNHRRQRGVHVFRLNEPRPYTEVQSKRATFAAAWGLKLPCGWWRCTQCGRPSFITWASLKNLY